MNQDCLGPLEKIVDCCENYLCPPAMVTSKGPMISIPYVAKGQECVVDVKVPEAGI